MSGSRVHYRSILKATSLIGGSAFINIIIGMVRTKFVAVLLGPTGVGLMGLYSTLLQPIATITGMGLNSSGVRQIAEANGTANPQRVAKVVIVLRRTVWGTGLLGSLATVMFSPWLSKWTFGSHEHTLPVAILGITVLLGNIAVGQSCVLQGMRRISDLAKMQVVGALNATLISVPCFYMWGIKGILPSLVLASIASLLTSWYFAHKVKIQVVKVTAHEQIIEIKRLLEFGFPLMATALQGSLIAYLLRLVIVNQFGLEGVGIWGAAFAISGVLVNFVLGAMGADYYPRLIAVSQNKALINREVNAQTEVALLIAGPALLVTLLFAPIAVNCLYSDKFLEAIPLLKWSVFGIMCRVLSWPLGYIILAQGRGGLCLITELIYNVLNLILLYWCGHVFGLVGTAIAFMMVSAGHVICMVIIARYLANVRLWGINIGIAGGILFALVAVHWMDSFMLNRILFYSLSSSILVLVTILSAKRLIFQVGFVSMSSLLASLRGSH